MKRGFAHGDPRASAAGRSGGVISGAQKVRQSLAKWEAQYPGVPVEAIAKIRMQGYQAGYAAGIKSARKRQEAA